MLRRLRRAIGTLHADPPRVLVHIKVDDKRFMEYKTQRNEYVCTKNKTSDMISKSYTKAVAEKWIVSRDWQHQLLAVMVSIGTRKVGLLDCDIKFEKVVPNDDDIVDLEIAETDTMFWIRQIGTLKTKEGDGDNIVVKPIAFGFTSDTIIRSIEYIRYKTGSIHGRRDMLTNRYNTSLVAEVKRRFPESWEHAVKHSRVFGTHFLRSVYANVIFYDNLPQFRTYTLTGLTNRILGHKNNSLTAALTYQCTRVVP
jgi:hypothetical protein